MKDLAARERVFRGVYFHGNSVMRFACEHCGQPVRVEERWAGRKGRCPHCKETVQIPAMPVSLDVARSPAPSRVPDAGRSALALTPPEPSGDGAASAGADGVVAPSEAPLAASLDALNAGGDMNLGTGLVTLAASEEEQSQSYVVSSPPPPPPREPPLSEDEVLLSGTGLDTLCDTVIMPAVQEPPPGATERDARRRRRREQREAAAAQQAAAQYPQYIPHTPLHPHLAAKESGGISTKTTLLIMLAVVVVLALAVAAFLVLTGH